MTASRKARSFAKWRYTVRSFTPARSATARIVTPRQSRIDELRFERARIRARERIATEQYYERIGYSPQRPYVPLSSMSFGGFGGPNVFYGYRSIGWAW